MSKPLVVVIPHKLGRAEAVNRLKAGLTKVSTAQTLIAVEDERWTADNRLEFRLRALGQGISGAVDVAEESARLEIILPALLAGFAEKVTSVLTERAKILLEKK